MQAVRSGMLPTVERELIRGGTQFMHAHTVFPSITTAAYVSALSGLYPGHMGIPYLTRFDRNKQRPVPFLSPRGRSNINKSFQSWYHATQTFDGPATIFDDLPDSPTASITTLYDHNANHTYPNFPFGIGWDVVVSKTPERMNRHTFGALQRVFARPDAHIPRFTIAGLLATDGAAHHYGTHSKEFYDVLIEFDHWLASFIQQLKERNIWDQTYIVLTSDHGMHDVKRKVDLQHVIQKSYPDLKITGTIHNHTNDIFIGERGVGAAIMTVRSPNGWKDPIDPVLLSNYTHGNQQNADILSTLRRSRDIAFTLVRNPEQAVDVYTRSAHGRVHWRYRNGRMEYRYEQRRGDPLHLSAIPKRKRTAWHSTQQWHQLLKHSPLPGVVPHFGHIFTDGSAGDIVVVAQRDVAFFSRKAATHGGPWREDMHIPLLVRGPDIPAGKQVHRATNIVDIYPTTRQWFGLPTNEHLMDGRPLFDPH